MSYNIYLKPERCPTCNRASEDEPDLPDPTYNLTPIFDLAISGEPLPNPETPEVATVLFGAKTDRPRGLRLLNGRKAKDTVDDLNRALERMSDETLRDKFLSLEPPNKWGDLPGAIWVINKLKTAAEEYPDSKWEIH